MENPEIAPDLARAVAALGGAARAGPRRLTLSWGLLGGTFSRTFSDRAGDPAAARAARWLDERGPAVAAMCRAARGAGRPRGRP